MSRRSTAGLVPLLATIALAVVPAVAQAVPHWYKKNVLVGSAPVATTTVGALTLNALGAEIKCKVNDKEEIWNPASGGPGEDVMTGFALIGCKNKVATAACPKGAISVISENLPWRTLLVTISPPNVIRDYIFGVRLNVGCSNSAGALGDVFEGTLTPEVGNGTLIFGGPGGGTLLDSFSNPLTVAGIDKFKAPPGKVTANDP
ncbi:MAG TPA: hypothetical protein VMG62_02200 [Solirubrobacteraceae bacterium]|nr:hypothetical protein [Solirubrobacteraceae bacterium]